MCPNMVHTQRTTPLTPPEIDEFFDPTPKGHLKYRLTMLLSWKDRTQAAPPLPRVPYQDAICGFEAALVACRLFIHFLGLRISHQPTLRLFEDTTYFDAGGRSDEVKVKDLGGEFVNIARDLSPAEADLLARTYNGANKATAHLTAGSHHGFPPDDLPKSIELICRLLKSHLYDKVGRPMERHYD